MLTPPAIYTCCLASDCPLAAKCLRHLVFDEMTADTTRTITVVNPKREATQYATSACTEFRSAETTRHARGMTHLFDLVPAGQLREVKSQVKACFSSERYYYLCRNGSRLVSPAQQEQIAAIFSNHDLGTPAFDAYEDAYEWQ